MKILLLIGTVIGFVTLITGCANSEKNLYKVPIYMEQHRAR